MAILESETPSAHSSDVLPEFLKRLRVPKFNHDHPPVRNANDVHDGGMSPLDKFAMAVTDKVGSVGFFGCILIWTIVWTGYNIIATEIPSLHWKSFDPFPAFVAYLLISNVIQILLMPMIMVGQNLQGRHTEIRAQLDFETNMKAEEEVKVVLRHLERNTELLLHLINHLKCQIPAEELMQIAADAEAVERIA